MSTAKKAQPRLHPGDSAPALTLLNASGKTVELPALWNSGPTVLTFLRHFG